MLLPSVDVRHASIRGAMMNAGYCVQAIAVDAEPANTLAARINAEISANSPTEPLTVVAFGSSALLLPSIALAQRAAHRRVREYLLVDPDVPGVSEGWPDARVTVFSDVEQTTPRLRGWDIRSLDDLLAWSPDED